jgi:hypothetical protein
MRYSRRCGSSIIPLIGTTYPTPFWIPSEATLVGELCLSSAAYMIWHSSRTSTSNIVQAYGFLKNAMPSAVPSLKRQNLCRPNVVACSRLQIITIPGFAPRRL